MNSESASVTTSSVLKTLVRSSISLEFRRFPWPSHAVRISRFAVLSWSLLRTFPWRSFTTQISPTLNGRSKSTGGRFGSPGQTTARNRPVSGSPAFDRAFGSGCLQQQRRNRLTIIRPGIDLLSKFRSVTPDQHMPSSTLDSAHQLKHHHSAGLLRHWGVSKSSRGPICRR